MPTVSTIIAGMKTTIAETRWRITTVADGTMGGAMAMAIATAAPHGAIIIASAVAGEPIPGLRRLGSGPSMTLRAISARSDIRNIHAVFDGMARRPILAGSGLSS